MLNINTAVSLDLLADDMIKKINEVWKNPFDSPFVIFPNTKMAQWFKLKWLEKYGSLANLEVKRLDIFIFESLINESESERYNLLTTDLLRNIIIAYFKVNDLQFYIFFDCSLNSSGCKFRRRMRLFPLSLFVLFSITIFSIRYIFDDVAVIDVQRRAYSIEDGKSDWLFPS